MNSSASLKKAPIVYVTCGGVETHGAHNALGIDGYLGYYMALEAARISGGIVMPPLFIMCGSVPPWTWDDLVKNKSLLRQEARPSVCHGREVLLEVMKQTFWNMDIIGFKVCMVIPGHWPNILLMQEYVKSIGNKPGDSPAGR